MKQRFKRMLTILLLVAIWGSSFPMEALAFDQPELILKASKNYVPTSTQVTLTLTGNVYSNVSYLYGNGRLIDEMEDQGNGVFTYTCTSEQVGSVVYYANTSGMMRSNETVVEYYSTGNTLDAPEIIVQNRPLEVDEPLYFSWPGVKHAEYYLLKVYRESYYKGIIPYMDVQLDTDQTSVMAGHCKEGRYKIIVTACAQGYESAESVLEFSVPEQSTPNELLYFDTEYDTSKHVYMMPNEEVHVQLKDVTTGKIRTLFEANLQEEKYELILEKDLDSKNISGLQLDDTAILKFTKNADVWGNAGILKLVDVKSGEVIDQRTITYVNTYRKGLANLEGYTGQMARYSEIEQVTDGHGYVIGPPDPKELEIVEFKASPLQQDDPNFPEGYYNVTFEILNGTAINYGISVADREGNTIESSAVVIVPPYSPTTPICRVIYEGGKILVETLTFNIEKSFREMEKSKTQVSLKVPNGGWVLFDESSTHDAVKNTNIVEFIMTLITSVESGKKMVQGIMKKWSLSPNMIYTLDRDGLAGYFMESGLYDALIKKISTSEKRNFTKEIAIAFVTENYDQLEAAIDKYMSGQSITDPAKLLKNIGSVVEGSLVQLNPTAYATESVTNLIVQLDRLNRQLKSINSTNLSLNLSAVIMPYRPADD